MSLYRNSPLPTLPPGMTVNVGSTQRMMTPVGGASYSGQLVLQTYMSTVNVFVMGDTWMHDLSDSNPKADLQKREPFQMYRIYTTSLSSPDGDLPYKHGDVFIPNGALPGLQAGVAHPIRGVAPYPVYAQLTIERKL